MNKAQYRQAYHDYRCNPELYSGPLKAHFRMVYGHVYRWHYTPSQWVYIGVNPAYCALVEYIRDNCKLKNTWPSEGKFAAYMRYKS